jgi:hypothetical protein
MVRKKKEKTEPEVEEENLQQYDNPQENLLGVFSILLDVAKRTNPEKYLIGYKKNND